MVENTLRTPDKPERLYQGLSTDLKPTTGVRHGDTYFELDTKKGFVYSRLNKNPVTNNGWWEV